MLVTFHKELQKDSIRQNRKEKNFCGSYILIDRVTGREVVNFRQYETAKMNYACIWIKSNNYEWISGGGKAGGYGYHRGSAAAWEAITNAGLKMSEDISGRGDSAIKSALAAIYVWATGNEDYFIVNAHP